MELQTNNDFDSLRERTYKFIALCEAYLQQGSNSELNNSKEQLNESN